jgi:hypothetical protein
LARTPVLPEAHPVGVLSALQRHSGSMDTRRHAPRKLRCRARHPAQGRDGLDADHPGTWPGLRRRWRLGTDSYDAHDNIIAGAAYLRALHDGYCVTGFLAVYNAGPARWEDHLATGRPLLMETQAHLARVAPVASGNAPDDVVSLVSIDRSWTEACLFVARSGRSLIGAKPALKQLSPRPTNDRRLEDLTGFVPQSDGLFVALSLKGRSQ